jgi:hypothetical protein
LAQAVLPPADALSTRLADLAAPQGKAKRSGQGKESDKEVGARARVRGCDSKKKNENLKGPATSFVTLSEPLQAARSLAVSSFSSSFSFFSIFFFGKGLRAADCFLMPSSAVDLVRWCSFSRPRRSPATRQRPCSSETST